MDEASPRLPCPTHAGGSIFNTSLQIPLVNIIVFSSDNDESRVDDWERVWLGATSPQKAFF